MKLDSESKYIYHSFLTLRLLEVEESSVFLGSKEKQLYKEKQKQSYFLVVYFKTQKMTFEMPVFPPSWTFFVL